MHLTGYIPGKRFVSISITGNYCALRCMHCMGKYLKGMIPVKKGGLFRMAMALEAQGYNGILISGGCDSMGRVPLWDYITEIKKIKRYTSLLVNVHTGLVVDKRLAQDLYATEVDTVSYDLLGLDWVAKHIYGINTKNNSFLHGLEILTDTGLNVYPHINIGLYNGILSHEFAAINGIETLSKIGSKPQGLVFIIMIPTPGTPMAHAPLINVECVKRVFEYASKELNIELILGCMRPKTDANYNFSIEKAAFHCGITRIVMPSKYLQEYLTAKGITIKTMDTCCTF